MPQRTNKEQRPYDANLEIDKTRNVLGKRGIRQTNWLIVKKEVSVVLGENRGRRLTTVTTSHGAPVRNVQGLSQFRLEKARDA